MSRSVHESVTDLKPSRHRHRRAAHAQVLGEVALRRQALARAVFTPLDERRDLVGDLSIEAAVVDGLQRHLVKW